MEILCMGLGCSIAIFNICRSYDDIFRLCKVIRATVLVYLNRILLCKLDLNFKRQKSCRLLILKLITKIMLRIVLLVNGFFWIRKKILHLDLENNPILRQATSRASTIVCNHLACYVNNKQNSSI